MTERKTTALVPGERIERRILSIRGQTVMLDVDLAELYEVATKNLVKAVTRNLSRFRATSCFSSLRRSSTV